MYPAALMHGTSVALCGAAALAVVGAGPAPDAPPAAQVRDARMRVLLASRPAGGYFDLDNHAAEPLTLTGAASPGCGSLMLHRSMNSGGTDSMAAVDHVSVPAHGSLRFAPGGYHLMCMQPVSTLRPGTKVPVTLTFEGGGSLTTNFAVEGAHGR
ncbi:copper chaperone PCu(A)C [Rhodopila sp.]|uniref:copper chaperone PCu(A)C n=1 Tax=Rhodopila sp. TaxID=2480087 RepID=UPI003D0B29E4